MKFGNLLAIIVISLMMHSSLSRAALVIDVTESGGDVIATMSGSVNPAGLNLTGGGSVATVSRIAGSGYFSNYDGQIIFGSPAAQRTYLINSSAKFSRGRLFLASSQTGDFGGVTFKSDSLADRLHLRNTYVSGAPLSATSTFSGTTISQMGLIPGTYTYWWPSDTITINIESPSTTYTVGGTVSGLTGTGLELQNNGGDTLAVAAAATAFTFATELPDSATYAVTVSAQPTGQTCSVTGGDNDLGGGAIAAANVTDVVVTCVDGGTFTFSNVSYTADSVTFTIDGDMSGYAAGNVLNGFSLVYAGDIMMPAMTAGNSWSRSVFDNKTISETGATDDFVAGDYTWSKYVNSLLDASVNNATVTVTFSHPHLNESAVSPSISFVWGIGLGGTVLATVTPTVGGPPPATFSVGGTVSGLTGSVTLQNNGSDDIIKTTNDGFTFPAQAAGTDYKVEVSSQPTGQTCTVANGSGTNITANITNVTVTCVTDVVPTYSVGGTVSGLTGTGLELQNNGADTLAVAAADTAFTFATELPDSATYAVTVSTQPTGQTCSVTGGDNNLGGGAIAGANVTSVIVTCVTNKADQTITGLAANPATGVVVEGSSALSATASSGLTVSFGSSTPTVCTVTGATVSYLAAGTCTVTADQAGNAAYNAATQVTLNIKVAKADQTIVGLTADPASGVIGGTSTLSVSSTASVARIAQSGQERSTTKASSIPVTFGSNTLTICTVVGSTVSYLAAGTCTVTADQAGDADYNPAPQVTLDINVIGLIPNVPVPTLSLWGLLAMFLMMLGIGGMVARRKTRS